MYYIYQNKCLPQGVRQPCYRKHNLVRITALSFFCKVLNSIRLYCITMLCYSKITCNGWLAIFQDSIVVVVLIEVKRHFWHAWWFVMVDFIWTVDDKNFLQIAQKLTVNSLSEVVSSDLSTGFAFCSSNFTSLALKDYKIKNMNFLT